MSSRAQRQIIIGAEATPGDGATPDVALRAVAELRAVADKVIPDEDIGSFAPARNYLATLKAEGNLKMDAYYEHAPYLVSMAMGQGGVSGASDPYTWTFELPDTTPDDFQTYRVEFTDGADHVVRADDVFATSLTISGEAGGPVMIEAELSGGAVTFPSALGATLTPLAQPTAANMSQVTMWIDNGYGTIGTTQMGELISFNWKLEGLQHHKQFAGALYPNGRGHDKWDVTLEIVAEMENGVIEGEKDKLLSAGGISAIRIRSSASSNDRLTIDGVYIVTEVDNLDERDGNNIVKITYKAQKDSSDNVPSIVIITNLAAL